MIDITLIDLIRDLQKRNKPLEVFRRDTNEGKHDVGEQLECLLSALSHSVKGQNRIQDKEDLVRWSSTLQNYNQQEHNQSYQQEPLMHQLDSNTENLNTDGNWIVEDQQSGWGMAIAFISCHLLPTLAPLQLHAIVMQSINWINLPEELLDADNSDPSCQRVRLRQDPQNESSDGSLTHYSALCLILCSMALNQCPNPATHRQQRWRSIGWETLRIFQHYCNLPRAQSSITTPQEASTTTKPSTSNFRTYAGSTTVDYTIRQYLWMQYLLPALIRVRVGTTAAQSIQNGPTLPTLQSKSERRYEIAINAAIIGTTTRLARMAVEQFYDNTSIVATMDIINNDSEPRNISSTDSAAAEATTIYFKTLSIQLDALLYGLEQLSRLGDVTASCSADRRNLPGPLLALLCKHPWRCTVTGANLPVGDPGDSDEALVAYYTAPEANFGEADIASSLVEDRQDALCGARAEWDTLGLSVLVARTWYHRPLGVWTAQYQWYLWFPHVVTLWIKILPKHTAFRSSPFDAIGCELFDQLICGTPNGSLKLTRTRHRVPTIKMDPLSPLPLLVRWCHQIVQCSKPRTAKHMSPRVGATDAPQLYNRMKSLVGKYKPMDQVDLVRFLIDQASYHDGLHAKMLDLWRLCVSWRDTDAEYEMWIYLNQNYLLKLDTYWVFDPTTEKYSLRNMNDLIASADIYCAVIGLMQLACKMGADSVHTIGCLPRLAHFQKAIKSTIECTQNDAASLSSECFRLFLLEHSTTQALLSSIVSDHDQPVINQNYQA